MKFKAEIDIMHLKALLDPQGKTVTSNMTNVGIQGVEDVRIGKHVQMSLEAGSLDEAKAKVEESCKKLLANPIMESFTFELIAD